MEDIKQRRFAGSRFDVGKEVHDWFSENPTYQFVREVVHDNFMGDPMSLTVDISYIEVEPELHMSPEDLPYTVTFDGNSMEELGSLINEWLCDNQGVEILQMNTMHAHSHYMSILVVKKKVLKVS